jgi:hypothetical protein
MVLPLAWRLLVATPRSCRSRTTPGLTRRTGRHVKEPLIAELVAWDQRRRRRKQSLYQKEGTEDQPCQAPQGSRAQATLPTLSGQLVVRLTHPQGADFPFDAKRMTATLR